MKFFSPSTVLGGLLALAAGLFLASCGGGGAAGNPNVTGALTISPATGTLYAGLPYTFQLLGGRKPYFITSSEAALLPVPSSVDGNSFEVVAGNPGVIDPNLPVGSLPVKTVTIAVRSGDGLTASAVVQVGQNFLTGYGINFQPVICPIQGVPTGAQACAGGESAVTFSATFAGNLGGDRTFQLQAIKGNFQFALQQSGVVGNTPCTQCSLTTVSDHSGTVTAVIQVPANTPTQVAVIRIIDQATGVYDDHAFVINGPPGNGTLTPIPTDIKFTGNQTTDCGGGVGSFIVTGGVPPFTAVSSSSRVALSSTTSNANPGQFTVTVAASSLPCASGTIAITDTIGNTGQVTVESVPGTIVPPTPAKFTVAPDAITLGCFQSGSVSVVGGSGSYSTSPSVSFVTTTVSGNTVTITRTDDIPRDRRWVGYRERYRRIQRRFGGGDGHAGFGLSVSGCNPADGHLERDARLLLVPWKPLTGSS